MGTSDSQPCNQWHRWQPGLAMASEAGWFGGQPSGGLRLPQWLSGKESACSAGDAGDTGSIPGLGRSPGKENGSPLQYSCLENPMDRGVWWFTVHRVQRPGHDWSDWAHMHAWGLVLSLAVSESRGMVRPPAGVAELLGDGESFFPLVPLPNLFLLSDPCPHLHIGIGC